MISHRFRCVFVHVPKTAGQSVEQTFITAEGRRIARRRALLLRQNRRPRLGPPRLGHLTAEEYVTNGFLSRDRFRDYFVFGFVRNPWDRLVSEYRYRGYPYPFRDFVLAKFPGPADDNYRTGVGGYRHVLPQSDFLFDAAGNQLVDFIGRFENLAGDFAVVRERVGLPPGELPHVNRSNAPAPAQPRCGPAYRDYYDAETRGFVETFYANDIDRFGYAF